ncbi:hypothetical protein HK097_010805 [Rhizophlyctis rosea]|uniref:SH3 domain-containing protein n=1 Tax=Rhizophlyctis rosea TaxID=64517 RepID=A0AAD5X2A7_9FUNG|nr:hypothetical protein HK097_010805 [Rhizophlyctis rosea]
MLSILEPNRPHQILLTRTIFTEPPGPYVKVLLKPIFEDSAVEEQNALNPLLERFYNQTGIYIDTTILPNAASYADYFDAAKPFIEAANGTYDMIALDVAWLQVFPNNFIDLFEFGRLHQDIGLNISARITEQIPDIVNDDSSDDRHLIALPMHSDYGVLFYRQDLLSQYNVSIPQVWDDIPKACSKILPAEAARGNTKLRCYISAFQDYEVVNNVMEWLTTQQGTELFDYPRKLTFDSPEGIKTFRYMSNWTTSGIIRQEVFEWDYVAASRYFYHGESLFWRGRISSYPRLKNQLSSTNRTIDVAPLPVDAAGNPAALLQGYHLGMTKTGPYPKKTDVAAALLFLTSMEVQRVRARTHGVPPTMTKLLRETAATNNDTICEVVNCTFIHNDLQALNIPALAVAPHWAEVLAALSPRFIAMMKGTMSPEDGIREASSAIRSIVFSDGGNGSNKNTATILLAVLVPVGIILVGASGFVYGYRRHRKREKGEGGTGMEATGRTSGAQHEEMVANAPARQPSLQKLPPRRRQQNTATTVPEIAAVAIPPSSKTPEMSQQTQPFNPVSGDGTDRWSGIGWDRRSRQSSLSDDAIGKTYNVIHPYKPVMADELELKSGDRVVLRLAYDDGYAYGTIENSEKGGVFPLACLVPVGMEIELPSRLESGAGPEIQAAPEKVDSLEMLLLSGRITEGTYLALRREQEEELKTQRQITALRERLMNTNLEPEERRKLQKRLDELELGI